ncbi:MAG: LacI family DNA-binding transcriptional regulator [Phycisphaeraceae bacterium]|nr:LacI family DNA-binding transcriptional regulator [Phycisphaeraceae bacterium]
MSAQRGPKVKMSIVQLAQRAGVSHSTVSRVINGRAGVSAELLAKVQHAIEETGYQPPPPSHRPGPRLNRRRTANARPTRRRHNGQHVIGVVVLEAHYRYTASLFAARLNGIQQQAAEYGYSVQVFYVDQTHKIPDAIRQRRVDGLIFDGPSSSPLVEAMMAYAPSIWSGSHQDPSGMKVLAGNYLIGRMAAEYLLRRGHKQLGFLGVQHSYPAFPARAEAFEATALRANARVQCWTDDEPHLLIGSEEEMMQMRRGLDQQVARLAEAKTQVTGLFVPSDMMTCVVYASLRDRGIQPGRDIDIISCSNDRPYLMGLRPQPATIDVGAELIGRKSVELLLWSMNRGREDREVHLTVEPVLIEPRQW